VGLRGAGAREGDGRLDPVTGLEQRGDVLDRRDAQAHAAAARADGDHDVLRAGCAEQPDRARRRLFDRLEQHVGGALGHAVGVLDEDHPPPSLRGGAGGEGDERAHLVDRDGDLLGRDDREVGVGPGEGRGAGVAVAAAALLALERCGEGTGSVGPA